MICLNRLTGTIYTVRRSKYTWTIRVLLRPCSPYCVDAAKLSARTENIKPPLQPLDVQASRFAHAKIRLRASRIVLSFQHHTVKKPDEALVFKALEELLYYLLGLRLYLYDVLLSSICLLDYFNRPRRPRPKDLSCKEQVQRALADTVRLGPFLVIAALPAAPVLLAIYIKMFPFLLPSTFAERYDRSAVELEIKSYSHYLNQELQRLCHKWHLSEDLIYVLQHIPLDDVNVLHTMLDRIHSIYLKRHLVEGYAIPAELEKLLLTSSVLKRCHDTTSR